MCIEIWMYSCTSSYYTIKPSKKGHFLKELIDRFQSVTVRLKKFFFLICWWFTLLHCRVFMHFSIYATSLQDIYAFFVNLCTENISREISSAEYLYNKLQLKWQFDEILYIFYCVVLEIGSTYLWPLIVFIHTFCLKFNVT